MVDLDKLRDITLEPRERLVILVMNTDDLLILNTDSARAEVDAFEKLLNQSFEATSRATDSSEWMNPSAPVHARA